MPAAAGWWLLLLGQKGLSLLHRLAAVVLLLRRLLLELLTALLLLRRLLLELALGRLLLLRRLLLELLTALGRLLLLRRLLLRLVTAVVLLTAAEYSARVVPAAAELLAGCVLAGEDFNTVKTGYYAFRFVVEVDAMDNNANLLA